MADGTKSGLASGTNGSPQLTLDNNELASKVKENETTLMRIIPGKDGVVIGGNPTTLGRRILQTYGVTNNYKWCGYQAHHIIPVELKDHPIIKKIGMDLDDHSNGVLLRTPDKEVSTTSRHKGYHKVYSKFVKSELDKINPNGSSISIQRQVASLQTKLRKLQESGLPIYEKDGATIEMWQRYLGKFE